MPEQPSPANGNETVVSGNRGRFTFGNQRALKTGAYAEVKTLPPDICQWRADLEADQGGAEQLATETLRAGYVRRLAVMEYQLRRIEQRIASNKSERLADRTFAQYMALLGKWDVLAQRLGLERRSKDLGAMTIHGYLQAQEPGGQDAADSDHER